MTERWFVRHRQDWIAETLRVFGFNPRRVTMTTDEIISRCYEHGQPDYIIAADRLKILQAECASLRAANNTWVDMFGPAPSALYARAPGCDHVQQGGEAIRGDVMSADQAVKDLADAMWQLLDDMGKQGQSVCLLAKAKARLAFEPFRDKDESEFDDWMSVADAKAVIDDVERSR